MNSDEQEVYWLVLDPQTDSTLADICYEQTIEGLIREARGGLDEGLHPRMYDKRRDAEWDARARLQERDAALAETEVFCLRDEIASNLASVPEVTNLTSVPEATILTNVDEHTWLVGVEKDAEYLLTLRRINYVAEILTGKKK